MRNLSPIDWVPYFEPVPNVSMERINDPLGKPVREMILVSMRRIHGQEISRVFVFPDPAFEAQEREIAIFGSLQPSPQDPKLVLTWFAQLVELTLL